MSSTLVLEKLISVTAFLIAVTEFGGHSFGKNVNILNPHFGIRRGANCIYVFTNEAEDEVTEITRYGSNDPAWVIEILEKVFKIDCRNCNL